jgi:hypothetical protein
MTDNGNEKALVPIFRGEAEAVHPLARFGESRVVRALSDRILMTDRRKVPLSRNEAILTAQAAVAYRLDPFMGEIWSWVNVFQGRRVLTIMRGRDGTLKIAKRNAEKAGTYLLSPKFELLIDESKRAALGIPDGAMAVMCYQEDKASVDDWYQRVQTLKDAGFTAAKIEATVGDIPRDEGLGILTAQEMGQLDRSGNKMTHLERVQKRAHMAALRKRFAAQEFGDEGDESASIDTDDYIIEGEWLEVPLDLDDDDERSQEEKESSSAQGSDVLFGEKEEGPDRKSPAYWPKAVLEALVPKYAENDFQAAGMLSYSAFDKTVAKTPATTYAKAYRAARDEDVPPKEAGEKGMAAYLSTLKGGKKK